MRYFVALGAREIPVDVTALPTGGWDVQVEGERISVDAVSAGDALSLRIDGRVVDLVLEGSPPKLTFAAFGARGDAVIETERTRSSRSLAGGASAKGQNGVVAPMPGRVVRLLVAPGDAVEVGAPLIVIEAMKMENELRAVHAAQIGEIFVRAGDTVEGGAKLISFA